MQRPRRVAAALLLVVGFACCTQAKTPIFILPGIGTSNLVGVKTDSRFIAECPLLSTGSLIPGLPATPVTVWTPAAMLASPSCWGYMMQLKYEKATGRISNNDGASVTAVTGGSSGMEYPLFAAAGYEALAAYLESALGYTRGVDLFAVPYDFRQDLTAMNATGELSRIADTIAKGVEANGGEKAVLIGHSMGGLVSTALLSYPAFAAWRSNYVKGFLALAVPYGGAVPAVSARISGQLLGMPWLTSQLLGLSVDEAVYRATWGQPSVVMLLPYSKALPSSTVVAATPSRSYTVAQLQQLMADIGDQQAADMFSQVHSLDSLLSAPLPVPTGCVYGRRVSTPLRWRFSADVAPNQRSRPGRREASGMGDGVVNIQSLRLCKNLISGPAGQWVSELASPSIDHMSVLTNEAAHKAIGSMLAKLL